MKNLFVLFLLPLLSFNFLADWHSYKLDERASILFPITPTEEGAEGNKMWIANIDSTSRCMVMIMDFGKLGMDSAQVAEEFAQEDSYEIFKKDLMEGIGKGELIDGKVTTTHGYKTFEFVINIRQDASIPNYMYNKNIFVGNKMYVLYFFELNKTAKNEHRDKFFQSFTLN